MSKRGAQRLDAKQEAAIELVARRDMDYRIAKITAESRIRKLVEEELAVHRVQRADAVYGAAEMGVPKTRIAREGLGTSATNEIYEIIAEYEARGLPEEGEGR